MEILVYIYKWHITIVLKYTELQLTYLLTYLLTELSPSWEATNCAATQELPSILWNPKLHHRVHKSPPMVLSTLFSNTLSLCSSLNVRDQVSHPYRATGKIILLYILIFMLLYSRRANIHYYEYDTFCFYVYIHGASSGCGWMRRPPDMEGSCEYIE
jgi:hypothetical protein